MRKQPLFLYEVISVRFKFYCRSLLPVKKKLVFFYIINDKELLGKLISNTDLLANLAQKRKICSFAVSKEPTIKKKFVLPTIKTANVQQSYIEIMAPV